MRPNQWLDLQRLIRTTIRQTGGTQGPAGPQGPQGIQGPQGPQGVKGDTGDTGPAGANGTNGTNGTNGVGVPTGGLTNQVLAKASATDYDTNWVDVASPSTIVGITGTKAQFDTACTDGNFLYVGDVTSNATHTGDVTGATALTIANGAVTYAKMQNVAANSFLANATGSAATVQEIATTRIPLFGSAITGTPSASTYLRGDGSWQSVVATDPSGYTFIVKPSNQDVTNLGLTNDTDFSFATTANGVYGIQMELYISGNDTTGDFTMDLRVDAGTMTGKGTVQNLTAAAAVQNIIMTAAAAANTTAVITGAPTANLNDVVAVRVGFACSVSNATTLRFRFGNASASAGRTSRVWKGSVFKYKSLL